MAVLYPAGEKKPTFCQGTPPAAAAVCAQAHQLHILSLQAVPARRQHRRCQLGLGGAALAQRLGGKGELVAHRAVAGQVVPALGVGEGGD